MAEMTDQEQRALMTLVLMAAFADGRHDERERAELDRVAKSLAVGASVSTADLYQDVLLKRVTLDQAARGLASPDARRLAYELCVGACDADGAQNEAERSFLASLASALGFDATQKAAAAELTAKAEALAVAPLATPASGDTPATTPVSALSTNEIEQLIVNAATLNGALELLPDTLASMAIIPLQMKMVYRIGRSYGFELDRRHVSDFLATAGIGLASQYVEQIGVRLIGKVFGGGLIGGLLRGAAKQSVSSGFSFATTYALGTLAVRYYSSGRTLTGQDLRDTYATLLNDAKGLYGRHLPAIQERARSVNLAQLVEDVRR